VQLQPGAKLGGYRILSHLTKGGMGSLYVARKDGPGGFERDVVLKVVHKELSIDDEFVRLFLQEARLSALIRHPNVVHVEDLGQEGATYFIVMELFDGVSLSRVLKRMRKRNVEMAIPIAVHIACAVAEGLHAAHRTTDRQGRPLEIVHRDATPHNVLVGRTGHVKLIDFGIAKARNATVYTQKGMVRGKIAYLAPEQVWGRPVDRRTDVYALGALLYEMLAGRRLVTAESQAELFAKVREPDHPPIRVFRQVPPALDQVVMTALSPSPDQRYRTARDMRDALLEACPDAAKIHAEDLAPLVLEMADKELNALRRVIRSAHSQAPPPSPAPTPGPPADAPPQPMAASAQSEVPTTHEPIPPTVGQAMQLPDTDASLRAAGIDPRGNAAQAVKTMPIPLVSPEPSPSSGPRQRVETAPAPGAIPRTRMETGSGTTTASRSGPRPLRFSKEVELDQQAIERARLASKRKRRKRIIIALAIVTPFLGAALVVGVMLLRSFVR
jgi:serine/threonine-protein kinase